MIDKFAYAIFMDAQFFSQLQNYLSDKRLQAYTKPGDQNIDTLARYVWNMRLCEAFCPVLQGLEIVLRNSLHEGIAIYTRDPHWLHSSNGLLRVREQQLVLKAEGELNRRRKAIEPGRLVAELNFGFWTSLLNRDYESSSRTNGLWPALLAPVFPHVPRRLRSRTTILDRVNNIRHFRNRVFHHETIWYFSDLDQAHDDILEAIRWISPEMEHVVKVIDGYPKVSHPDYFDSLKSKLLAAMPK